MITITTNIGCSVQEQTTTNKPTEANQSELPQDIMKDYHSFVSIYDNSNVQDMRPDLTNPLQNQQDYSKVNELLTQALDLQHRMDTALIQNPELQSQAQIKPFIQLINARVAILNSTKSTYERIGVDQSF